MDADVPGAPELDRQVTTFEEALRVARSAGLDPELVHLANSAAALSAPRTRFDLCRIGIALYGVDPFGATGPGEFGLHAAMTVRTSVVNVKRVPAGTGVSYGPEHVTGAPTTLALLPLGYADGLPAPRVAAAGCGSPAGGARSSGASPWTSAWSTSGTFPWRSATRSWCSARARPTRTHRLSSSGPAGRTPTHTRS